MVSRRALLAGSVATASAVALAACSPEAAKNTQTSGGSSDGDTGSGDTLTFRIWDEVAAPAYESVLKAFTEQTGIKVNLDLVPWADYWTKLPLDINDPTAAPDVFWLNTANFLQYKDGGNLVNVTEALGDDVIAQWQPLTSELYTRDDAVWGVPQIWDAIAMLYNKKLATEAGVELATQLVFDPSKDTDTLREAASALTRDSEGRSAKDAGFDPTSIEVFGFNAQADFQAIIGPFIEGSGAKFATDDAYTFASPEGIGAFDYLAAMINKWHLAPSAADTNENGDFTRDLFIQGKLGLFQTGPYSLKSVGDAVGDSFEWDVAPLVAGPAGSFTNVHAVIAAGNAKSDKLEATIKLLEFLGSAEAQRPLGEQGVSFPAHVDAQDSFVEYWKGHGVDVTPFITAVEGDAVSGTKVSGGGEALNEAFPFFKEVLAGNLPGSDGIPKAQEAGNAVLGS